MAHNPPLDVATHLGSNSTAYTLGTNLFVGPVRASAVNSTSGTLVPVECAFMNSAGGSPPSRVLGTSKEIRFGNVQLRVRGKSTDFASGLALIRTGYTTLQSANVTNYMDISANQTEPLYLGLDENGNHHWALNFTVSYNST